MDLPWWRGRHEACWRNAQRPGRSDLPRRLHHPGLGARAARRSGAISQPVWQRFYGDRNAVNMGFNGDTTAHLLWRIQNGEVDGIAPKVAVDPDRRQQSRPAALVGGGHRGRHRRHRRAAAASAAADAGCCCSACCQSSVPPGPPRPRGTINRLLAARYRRGGDVTYLDVGQVFMRDGRLDRDLFFDPLLTPPDPPLHPTAQGQALMAAAIEPTLAALMGDRPTTPRRAERGRQPSASASSSIASLANAPHVGHAIGAAGLQRDRAHRSGREARCRCGRRRRRSGCRSARWRRSRQPPGGTEPVAHRCRQQRRIRLGRGAHAIRQRLECRGIPTRVLARVDHAAAAEIRSRPRPPTAAPPRSARRSEISNNRDGVARAPSAARPASPPMATGPA